MPFFCTNLKSNNQSVTLQVRILNIQNFIDRKRVSFSASASLTLEAALVLPLFLFAGVIMIMPLRIMDIQRQVQAIAEQVSEEIGQAAYLSKYTINKTDNTEIQSFETNEFWNAAAAYSYAELKMRTRLQDLPVSHLSLQRSRLLEDGEIIDLVVDYEIQMPFSVLGIKNVEHTSRSYRRAWVGEDGKSKGADEENVDDVIVYVGKNSTRYHISSTCHYLHNDLEAVSIKEVEHRRNRDGNRYSPCARCSTKNESIVYIMPSGRHYHSSSLCSAINAYVTAIPKSEVEHLGACSYCSKRK